MLLRSNCRAACVDKCIKNRERMLVRMLVQERNDWHKRGTLVLSEVAGLFSLGLYSSL